MRFDVLSFNHSVLFFLCCVGFIVYTTLLRGVARGSKYRFIGGVRSVCQTVRYEVAIILLLLIVLSHLHRFRFINKGSVIWIITFPLWIICFLAETNRAPFDFAEGERELVRGFNTEYRRVPFVLLFLAEYGRIIFLRYLSSALWFWGRQIASIGTFFLILLIRRRFPRFRYDFLIKIAWFVLLPVTIFILSMRILT